MSIYSKGLGFNFSLGKAKSIVIAGLIALFVIFALYSLYNVFSQGPIEAVFGQNPWVQSEQHSTMLFLKVSNTSGKDVKLTELSVKPKAWNSLIVYPANYKIQEVLAPNDSRTIPFNIRKAIPSQQLPAGNYTLDITAVFDGVKFSKEAVLEVK